MHLHFDVRLLFQELDLEDGRTDSEHLKFSKLVRRSGRNRDSVDNLKVSAASLKVYDADSRLFVVTFNDLRAPVSAQCAQVCLFQIPKRAHICTTEERPSE